MGKLAGDGSVIKGKLKSTDLWFKQKTTTKSQTCFKLLAKIIVQASFFFTLPPLKKLHIGQTFKMSDIEAKFHSLTLTTLTIGLSKQKMC